MPDAPRWLDREALAAQPLIAALVCTDCETEIGVQDGTPVGWRTKDNRDGR